MSFFTESHTELALRLCSASIIEFVSLGRPIRLGTVWMPYSRGEYSPVSLFSVLS